MKFLQPFCSTLVVLATTTAAFAQVSSINSVRLFPREFNDIPGASLMTGIGLGSPLSFSFTEQHVSASTGFANRDVWRFSNDHGLTAYNFAHNDYFTASMDLTLTGSPISPRKEAGWLFNTATEGDIQFIVNTDGHEVVQFGGISFYSFNNNGGPSYNSGDKITLGLSYFLDNNGKNALQFFANGIASPVFEFGPTVGSGALDIGDGSRLGAYFQIVNDPTNPNNAGTALFQNISITAVPEPSILALAGLGALGLILRRKR
jgi:hypothetical protein